MLSEKLREILARKKVTLEEESSLTPEERKMLANLEYPVAREAARRAAVEMVDDCVNRAIRLAAASKKYNSKSSWYRNSPYSPQSLNSSGNKEI